jgi:hypothetical protein
MPEILTWRFNHRNVSFLSASFILGVEESTLSKFEKAQQMSATPGTNRVSPRFYISLLIVALVILTQILTPLC